jgi:epoxyqueuosine reductase
MKDQIREWASDLGFSACGFARSGELTDWKEYYLQFIAKGMHAGFGYLERNAEKRFNPALVLPGARSVVGLLLNYFPEQTPSEKDNYIISKYALGRDYHTVMKRCLNQLVHLMKERFPVHEFRSFFDSGVVAEKTWAQRCGLGWQGKNTLLVNRHHGTYHFIGIILSTLELTPDPPEPDHCGSCRLCVDACPTHALENVYQLDIRRCISYYTIENKEPIPPEIAAGLSGRIFGCDICQDSCPYNRFTRPSTIPEFKPAENLLTMGRNDWESLTNEQFELLFSGTVVERTGYEHFMSMIRLNQQHSPPH